MKVRPLLILTGIVSSILGALVVYLMLSVPNDLRADGLMKEARKHITDGNEDQARQSLSQIVQQYPRTDAAAAATVALVSLDKKERDELQRAITQLRQQNEQQTKLIADLQKSVTTIGNRPPQVVTVQAPAPTPPVKKAAPKKSTTKKKPPAKKRRR
jgi:thioredoxin-like negative regulator of GroEL